MFLRGNIKQKYLAKKGRESKRADLILKPQKPTIVEMKCETWKLIIILCMP